MNIDAMGNRSAFIQVITDDQAYNIDYAYEQFAASKDHLSIMVGTSVFSESGIVVDINTPEITLTGEIRYSNITPLQSNIMGPFRFVPFLECNHGIISLHHTLQGSFTLNDTSYNFDKGIGYIEKDWGSSFPTSYVWTQCNVFENEQSCIMTSVATIPFMGMQFDGCICAILHRGIQYRLATYRGVRVTEKTPNHLVLRQGNFQLEVSFEPKNLQSLKAPDHGNMERSIHECVAGQARYVFSENGREIFDLTGKHAGYEYV